jgi:hypothetical protein
LVSDRFSLKNKALIRGMLLHDDPFPALKQALSDAVSAPPLTPTVSKSAKSHFRRRRAFTLLLWPFSFCAVLGSGSALVA